MRWEQRTRPPPALSAPSLPCPSLQLSISLPMSSEDTILQTERERGHYITQRERERERERRHYITEREREREREREGTLHYRERERGHYITKRERERERDREREREREASLS